MFIPQSIHCNNNENNKDCYNIVYIVHNVFTGTCSNEKDFCYKCELSTVYKRPPVEKINFFLVFLFYARVEQRN